MTKGVDASKVLAVVMSVSKKHPRRDMLMMLLNIALKNKILPPQKEEVFVGICDELKQEGVL